MKKLDLQLSEVSGVPFYRQIVNQMGQLIRSGHLRAGDKLPSVRELARQLLVSLITIRRSYSDLETAGLIVKRQGQGTFVAETSWDDEKEKALEEAKEVLLQAVAQAKRLGLMGPALQAYLQQLSIQEAGVKHDETK